MVDKSSLLKYQDFDHKEKYFHNRDIDTHPDFVYLKEAFQRSKTSDKIDESKEYPPFFVINDKEQLLTLFDLFTLSENRNFSIDNKIRYIFRGQMDASWSLTSTAQRTFPAEHKINDTLYLYLIHDVVKHLSKLPIIKTVIDTYGIEPQRSHFFLLSLLQHYGNLSPLIDWTYSLPIASYFASKSEDSDRPESHGYSYGFNEYFSIYMLAYKFRNSVISRSERMTDYLFYGSTVIQYNTDRLPTHIPAQNTNQRKLGYVTDFEDADDKISGKLKISLANIHTSIFNLNIIPQKGMFIYNPSATKPIEEFLNNSSCPDRPHLFCFNIHSSLRGEVKQILTEAKIDDKYVYPNNTDLCSDVRAELDSITTFPTNLYKGTRALSFRLII